MFTQEATETAELIYTNIICRFGAPETPISDHGTNFLSKNVAKELCRLFDITKTETSSYHPQTAVERLNSTTGLTLQTYINNKDICPQLVPSIMMACRVTPCTQSNHHSPLVLLFGSQCCLTTDMAYYQVGYFPEIQHVIWSKCLKI